LDLPCENTILLELYPKLEGKYLLKLTKTEILDGGNIGKMNEDVFVNLGIAELNEGYVNHFRDIKILNLVISLILLYLSYTKIDVSTVGQNSTQLHIRRLCLCLVIYHQPLSFMSTDLYSTFGQVSNMLFSVFYSYLVYFWISVLHE
jgi:hypothetical protein